ncbi:hypothetical protein B0H16DRAFT_1696304 [Mycena metata]|uniref:Uncharacterized protein n=1 Tax=Mycena metata TaxID=1033252 RepID=A0AAD7I248_9AGAR|nr:hypothetical protein B0H16DRAFT_1696304 [Mycena metata]
MIFTNAPFQILIASALMIATVAALPAPLLDLLVGLPLVGGLGGGSVGVSAGLTGGDSVTVTVGVPAERRITNSYFVKFGCVASRPRRGVVKVFSSITLSCRSCEKVVGGVGLKVNIHHIAVAVTLLTIFDPNSRLNSGLNFSEVEAGVEAGNRSFLASCAEGCPNLCPNSAPT